MPASWKLVLIGGEITVLAAFTGLGVHLAMQPHNQTLVAPPSLLLPAASARAPRASAVATPVASQSARPRPAGLNTDWIASLGRQDRSLVSSQWNVLHSLIAGIERYLRDRVLPEMERRH